MNNASEEEKLATINLTQHAIGYFSVGDDGTYYRDVSGLKTIRIPEEYPLDLLHGFTGHSPEYCDTQLGHLLQWIEENKECLNNVQFVCTRGLMCKILNSHFDWRYDYKLYAMIFNGVIYASEDQQRTDYFYNENSKASFAGFRFEQYVNGAGDKDTSQRSLTNRSQQVVFKRSLGKFTFLYSAEVDGIWFNPKTKRFELVEVKTRKISYTNNGFERNKSRSWFLQSSLTSVDTFICGYRDDNFQLQYAKSIESNEVRESGKNYWTIEPCIRRLRVNFNQLKQKVKDPLYVYEVYKPSCTKKLKFVDKSFNCSFIPIPYREAVGRR